MRLEAPSEGIVPKGPAGSLAYLADTDQNQAQRFEKRLMSHDLDFIWGVRGGYGCLRWLKWINWDLLTRHSPMIIGYSDLTFIHAAINSQGMVSLHAPMITSLPTLSYDARQALWQALKGQLPKLTGKGLFHGRAEGILIGGNLTCLCHTIGTPFEPPWEGAILVLEDHKEPLYRIDRMLTQLLLSGRLNKLAGLAVGNMKDTGFPEKTLVSLLKDRLCGLGIPVIYELPIGHVPDNYPILLGGLYVLDAEVGRLTPSNLE